MTCRALWCWCLLCVRLRSPFYAISAKKAEEAAFAWPCSPLRPPVPFFGFACRELELATEAATLLPSSPASSPSFWGGGEGVDACMNAIAAAGAHQQLAALPELDRLVVADAGDESAVKCPAGAGHMSNALALAGACHTCQMRLQAQVTSTR